MNNVVKPYINTPKIHQFCITDVGAGRAVGETTIARLFTPTERSKVDSPNKGEQMNAGAECRVPVCRLLNLVVALVVAANFFFIFYFYNQY